jgi:hypothetical protein
MKTFCLDSQKDWDDGIRMLLFVVREAFQESLSLLLLMLLVYHIMWSILGISFQEHYKLNHSVWIQLHMANTI